MTQMEATSIKHIPISQAQALDRIIRAFKLFRELDPEMPLKSVSLFLHSSLNPDCSMAHLQESLGISQASCSRTVAALSEWRDDEKPGHGLLAKYSDPMDRRKKFVRLTKNGEQLVVSLDEAIMNPARLP